MFGQTLHITFKVEESSPQKVRFVCNFEENATVNNHPLDENSPNLVTLTVSVCFLSAN
jgi:hypothetical protein